MRGLSNNPPRLRVPTSCDHDSLPVNGLARIAAMLAVALIATSAGSGVAQSGLGLERQLLRLDIGAAALRADDQARRAPASDVRWDRRLRASPLALADMATADYFSHNIPPPARWFFAVLTRGVLYHMRARTWLERLPGHQATDRRPERLYELPKAPRQLMGHLGTSPGSAPTSRRRRQVLAVLSPTNRLRVDRHATP